MAESTLYEFYKSKVASLTKANDNKELVEVYSYKGRHHFEKLWKFPHPEKPILLVVWDGIPDRESVDKVKTKKYITPVDWAVGFSLHIKNSSPEIYPDLRILILDEKNKRNPDSDSLKFVYQSPDKNIISMPWIRIFSLQQSNILDRFLDNLYSDKVGSKNLLKDSSRSTSMSAERAEEDKKPTLISFEQDTDVTESQFFGLNIDVIYRNIIRLVNSFRGGVVEVEQSSAEDDTVSESSRDSQRTQHHDSGQDTEICDELMSSMEEAFRQKDRELDIIKGIWAASLTRPSTQGDHHAIANLVGPLLLTEEKVGDLHVNALQALMRSIGLLPDHKEGNALEGNSENAKAQLGIANSWIDWKCPEWKHKLTELLSKHGDKLNLILIDDMFQISWGKILCRAVGVDYKKPSGGDGKDQLVKISNWNVIGKDEKVVVKASSSAAWIIKKLEGFDGEDKRFDLSLDDGVGQEILFLDLRLYPGNLKTDKTEIEKFFEPLLTLAEKFIEGQAENLPWNGFAVGNKEGEKGEIERIKDWIKSDSKEQEDSEYIEALTLLPRILALTDLSLPIVLFSSTGKRNITEKLKNYGNIITVFEKPRFTEDIPVDIASQTRAKFRDAIEKAFSVLTGRQICRKVKGLVEKANSYANIIPARINIPKFKHIEIYIDESGSPKFWPPDKKSFAVGGLILAYPDYNEVNKLSEALKGEGYYWYSDDKKNQKHLSKTPNGQNKDFQGACAVTNWSYRKAKEDLLKLCVSKKVFISGICVQEKMSDIMGTHTNPDERRHIVLKDIQGDEGYKRLLNVLLELVIYEYIPRMIDSSGSKTVTLSIFPATRTPILVKDEEMFNEHSPDDYFGYGYAPKYKSYYTIARNSIHPIVSSILRCRNDIYENLTLHHARGVTFQYGVPTTGLQGNPVNAPSFTGGKNVFTAINILVLV